MLDVIGIGLGPFNLSLAALLKESSKDLDRPFDAKFFEQDSEFNWHKGMILPNTTLQVPFLADLVSLIDPTSHYSFLNYLHKHHRLLKFYFVEDFFVARKEYNHYCQWVADQLSELVFSARVTDVIRDPHSGLFTVSVEEQGQINHYVAKNVVIGTGTQATLPPSLQKIAQVAPHRCMHSAQFADNFDIAALSKVYQDSGQSSTNQSVNALPKILVLGSGQSSAEIYRELFDRQFAQNGEPQYQLDWMTRSAGFFPMEYSPLGLEHFSPSYTDYFYHLKDTTKQKLLCQQDLLYKGMGFSTIQDIYQRLYKRTIANAPLYSQIISNCAVDDVQLQGQQLVLTVHQKEQQQTFTAQYDCIIAGTGYQHRLPSCVRHLLVEVEKDEDDKVKIDRDYRLLFKDGDGDGDGAGHVYVQNQEIHSHGVGAPDLGLGAYRAGVIANQLLQLSRYDTQALDVFQQFGV